MRTNISFVVYDRSGSVPAEVVEQAHALDLAAFGEQFQSVRTHLAPSYGRRLAVAKDDAVVVGILLYASTSLTAQVEKLIVREENRRQGVGRALLEKVKASAGSRVLKLHVETTHDAAFRLYDTAGFRRVGTVPDYYGTGRHAISMELDPTND